MSEFDQVINRRGTSSVKWDMHPGDDLLHLWVADTDFPPPPAVREALQKRLEHGIFGYTMVGEEVRAAVMQWTNTRYHWEIQKEWLLFSPGVVPSLSFAVQAYTQPDDKVLIQAPVYAPFFDIVRRNGRELVVNELLVRDGRYEMDFAALERQLQDGVKLFILCSPHNPVGRVWTKEELLRLGNLCEQYDVLIMSDDIHADIIFSGHTHTPLASLSAGLADRTITAIAPSKTFNIAGLQASALIIPNEQRRKEITAVLQRQGFHSLNTFASAAMEAAYAHGGPWLDELLVYLEKNARFACDFLRTELPQLITYEPEGTYLLWVDCRSLGMGQEELMNVLQQKARIVVEPGKKFGPGSEGFIRINLGCPRSLLAEALRRLKAVL
ncbi:MalY/PatB family protein [Ectobacillus ponti]|uniref:cysteine-S-conjugate beta-lyase n=1 Tax=Ectobacillus ponti TaxID=2961894 RepID=A0AA41X6P4_9BACI|nr:MalY/PatB family protein [Ectobacillus ponti]MCP8969812.1 pyridoxal phosphate-dependent aminotransferase [Ectobacillus ponti]